MLNTVTGYIDSTFHLSTSSSEFRQRSGKRVRRGNSNTLILAKPELQLGTLYLPGADEFMYGLSAKQKAFLGPFALKTKAEILYPVRSQQVCLCSLPGTLQNFLFIINQLPTEVGHAYHTL